MFNYIQAEFFRIKKMRSYKLILAVGFIVTADLAFGILSERLNYILDYGREDNYFHLVSSERLMSVALFVFLIFFSAVIPKRKSIIHQLLLAGNSGFKIISYDFFAMNFMLGFTAFIYAIFCIFFELLIFVILELKGMEYRIFMNFYIFMQDFFKILILGFLLDAMILGLNYFFNSQLFGSAYLFLTGFITNVRIETVKKDGLIIRFLKFLYNLNPIYVFFGENSKTINYGFNISFIFYFFLFIIFWIAVGYWRFRKREY